jgi:hypothetical protein
MSAPLVYSSFFRNSGKFYIHLSLIIMEAYVTIPARTGIPYVAGAVHIIM